jgi:flap endonuclease-1
MGIKSLTALLKTNAPETIQTQKIYQLSGKRFGVDASLFIYKSLLSHKNLYNEKGEVTNHVSGIYYKTINYLSLGIVPVYIFDGKPPDEKRQVLSMRNKHANEAKEKMKSASGTEYLKYEKQSLRLQEKHIQDIKHLLTLMGVSYLHIDGEAEAIGSELCRMGYLDAMVTEDMDTLAFGCPVLIRKCIDKTVKMSDAISVLTLQNILQSLQLTYSQFLELCILCGCDYCENIPRIGYNTALQIIRKYESVDAFLESQTKYKIPENYKDLFHKSKALFTMYKDQLDIQTLPIQSSTMNKEALQEYLIHSCNLSQKRVQNSLNKLTKKYHATNLSR